MNTTKRKGGRGSGSALHGYIAIATGVAFFVIFSGVIGMLVGVLR